jgi:hypothetical protein
MRLEAVSACAPLLVPVVRRCGAMAARLDDAAAEAAEDALLRGVRAAFGAPPPLATALTARGAAEPDEEASACASESTLLRVCVFARCAYRLRR